MKKQKRYDELLEQANDLGCQFDVARKALADAEADFRDALLQRAYHVRQVEMYRELYQAVCKDLNDYEKSVPPGKDI